MYTNKRKLSSSAIITTFPFSSLISFVFSSFLLFYGVLFFRYIFILLSISFQFSSIQLLFYSIIYISCPYFRSILYLKHSLLLSYYILLSYFLLSILPLTSSLTIFLFLSLHFLLLSSGAKDVWKESTVTDASVHTKFIQAISSLTQFYFHLSLSFSLSLLLLSFSSDP